MYHDYFAVDLIFHLFVIPKCAPACLSAASFLFSLFCTGVQTPGLLVLSCLYMPVLVVPAARKPPSLTW